jgi:hypothetical protein
MSDDELMNVIASAKASLIEARPVQVIEPVKYA